MKQRMYTCISVHGLSKIINNPEIVFKKINTFSKYTERSLYSDGYNRLFTGTNIKIGNEYCDYISYFDLFKLSRLTKKALMKKTIFKNEYICKKCTLYTNFNFKTGYYNLTNNLRFKTNLYDNIEVLNTIDVSREKFVKG